MKFANATNQPEIRGYRSGEICGFLLLLAQILKLS
jgi:hypothetical protein